MADAEDLITAALIEIGVLAQDETLSAADGAWGLSKVNRMLSQWNARRLYCYVINHASYPWATSKQSYTIGPSGADFTATRPVKVLAANIIFDGDTRVPVEVLEWEQYSEITTPELSSSIPRRLYYQPTHPNGTLWPWPYPTDTSDELELFTMVQLSSFASLATTYDYPPGYEDAITYSLAEALGPSYGRTITQDLKDRAREARAVIQSLNSKAPRMGSDIPGSGGVAFDYKTGGF